MANQIKEIDNTDTKPVSHECAALFADVREKVLRLTEALYRTTDLFSDNEPLKWSLRESAIQVLNAASTLSANPRYEELRDFYRIDKLIDSVLIKTNLAASGTFIARINFDVLEREYIAIKNTLISPSFLKNGFMLNKLSSLPIAELAIGILEEKHRDNGNASQKLTERIEETEKEAAQQQDDNKSLSDNPSVKMSEMAMSERKNAILKLIGERGPSGVGDLTRLLDASVSEKTVQRDLTSLVESGILRKEGEKRWRRYYL